MSEFDKNLNVGDIITAYHKGYHRIIQISRRFYDNGFERGSLISYKLVADSYGNLKPKSKVIHECDILFCELAQKEIKNRIKVLQNVYKALGFTDD